MLGLTHTHWIVTLYLRFRHRESLMVLRLHWVILLQLLLKGWRCLGAHCKILISLGQLSIDWGVRQVILVLLLLLKSACIRLRRLGKFRMIHLNTRRRYNVLMLKFCNEFVHAWRRSFRRIFKSDWSSLNRRRLGSNLRAGSFNVLNVASEVLSHLMIFLLQSW